MSDDSPRINPSQKVFDTAELMSAMLDFDAANRRLKSVVARQFPIGVSVEVQLDTCTAIAVVVSYVTGCPDQLALCFENGNVWDKSVMKILRVI